MLCRSYRGEHGLVVQWGWLFNQHQSVLYTSQHFLGLRSLICKMKALIPDLLLQDEMNTYKITFKKGNFVLSCYYLKFLFNLFGSFFTQTP